MKKQTKMKLPEDPRERTWDKLEAHYFTPEQIERHRAEGARIVRQQLLRELRKSRGVTQAELAKKMGIKQATLSQFENQGDARVSTIRAWAEALGGHLRLTIDFGRGVAVDVGLGQG